MIVSDRREVVDELEPILRAGSHVAVSVPDGAEALRTLQDGVIPDLLISDLGSERALEGMAYIWRFRQLNRAGRHLAVVEDGAPFAAAAARRGLPRSAGELVPLPRPFDPAHVSERVRGAVDGVARDVERLRSDVWRELDQLRQSVRDVQREMVTALAQTIAARDPYMLGHSTRVAGLAKRVGMVMGLHAPELETLETAAILHEIGKMAVPLELLHKTDPLSEAELEQIRAHASVGAGIVGSVPSLRPVVPLVQFQNTDYQDLSRFLPVESPEFLLASVLRVVDAYDAMVSARSYRTAMPRAYWESNLWDGAGTRYHPQVVQAFFRACASEAPAEA